MLLLHQVVRVDPRRAERELRTLAAVIKRVAMVQATEVALMASVAARAPLRLTGTGIESMRPPLPPTQLPGSPVLLVHGFCGTKSSLSPIAHCLSAQGLTVDTITYTPFGTSVERLADRLVAAVYRILAETGSDKVHLVGHSLGGVVIAQAIADGRLDGLVDTVVTLGSPFGGSPWANLLPFGEVVRALRDGSPLLRRLATAPAQDGVRWLVLTATQDLVVPGLRSVPAHAKVHAVTVGGVGHLGMLLSRRVVKQVVGHILDAAAA